MKTDNKKKNTPTSGQIKYNPEKPLEKALKLSNDELLARAIADLLKRDELESNGEVH